MKQQKFSIAARALKTSRMPNIPCTRNATELASEVIDGDSREQLFVFATAIGWSAQRKVFLGRAEQLNLTPEKVGNLLRNEIRKVRNEA